MAASLSYDGNELIERKMKQDLVGTCLVISHLCRSFSFQKYRPMFNYSLSTPWYRPATEWSQEQRKNRRQLIKYPFLMECDYVHGAENINNDNRGESNSKRRRICY
jgi:hypothetical protein